MTTERDISVPLIIAHRGASRDYAENTLAAFRGAIDQGADWVELDVRRTADGVLVVVHDAEIGSGDGSVSDALRPVATLRAAELPGEVPTLADALAGCEHLGVNVEIKNTPGEPGFDERRSIADEVLAVVAADGRPARAAVLVTSFDLATVDRCRAVDPGVPTGLLTVAVPPERVARVVEIAATRGHVALHPEWHQVDVALVEAAHAAGLVVNAWTVDGPDDVRALATMGVDGVITNVPGVVRAALDG